MHRIPSLVALLSLTLITSGCASLNLKRPTAQVTGMSVADVNATGFTMNFDVSVTNPNSVTLPLSAVDYELAIGGTKLLEGKTRPQASIGGGETRTVALPVAVTFENLLKAEKIIASSGANIPYALSGGLTFDSGLPVIGQMRVPLSHEGTLALRDILQHPNALLGGEAAKKLGKMVLGGWLGK